MPITQQALDVHRAMSSRAWTVTEEYRIVFGKSSVITGCRNKLEDVWKNTSVVKTITEKPTSFGKDLVWSRPKGQEGASQGSQDQLVQAPINPSTGWWPEYRIVVNTIAGKSYEAVSHLFP